MFWLKFRESESKDVFTTAHFGGGVTGQPTFQTDSVEIKYYFSFRLILPPFTP